MLTSIASEVNQNVFHFPRTFSSKKALIRVYQAIPSPLATIDDILDHHGNIALVTDSRCIMVFIACRILSALVTSRWTTT